MTPVGMAVGLAALSLALLASPAAGIPPCQTLCPQHYQPVCGSNGVTYSNDCSLSVANCMNPPITKRHDGKCRSLCPEACGYNYDPVCGNNGKTYNNECELEMDKCNGRNRFLRKVKDGACN
ncbi:turripeptide Lol9.1-like [Penaeus chinensis]|uniref:turripeptide Lol9.1-like n=1 Tax=Penaeus chinensis TaxID=139456 RepID=UPI001FB85E0D|nr:turripeptide Lol9.1-like [Penaeus chinensis]XP_047472635.1 turripeptide Lol9.1-like [Penaeus chinensis]XP_047472636.1 turripeptide Lol9.1-like [Penaeus chinensis]